MKHISCDIETFSSVNLRKSGMYSYSESKDFEILLFGYSVDGGPVQVIDLASGEQIPDNIRAALRDPTVIKWAFNAAYERVCLSRYLGLPKGKYLDPASWRCTMVWAATLGLPLSLEGVGTVLGLEKQKLKEGRDLIRYFCMPGKLQDGAPLRHYPRDEPEKWERFKEYNLRDVEAEMAIQQKLARFPVPISEWGNYHLDQKINDRGIMLDMPLVSKSDMRLVDYINDMNESQQAEFLDQAMIPKGLPLEFEKFNQFYEARKELLAERIHDLLT